MSLTVQKADDSHAIYTFGKALEQLATRDGHLTPPLESFLASNSAKLAACSRPFGSPQSASRSKIDTGKFNAGSGEPVTLGEREKDAVKRLSDKLQIDEVEAAVHFKSYRRKKGEDSTIDVEASLCRSDDFWQDITAFVLEEQLRVVQLVALLLRSADFEARVPAEVVQRFTTEVTTPQFAQTLLDKVLYLSTTPVPTSAIPHSPLWAKSWVQQQKALLEVYFLLYYNRLFPNGKSLQSVLEFVQKTVWGALQANEGLFDSEAQALAQDVGALCHLILIENMNLERAASPEAEEFKLVPGQPLSGDEVLHPQTLEDIHQRILNLVGQHPRQSALLALSWSSLLFRITESISSVPLPETYYEVAQQILPMDLQPRKGDLSTKANSGEQALWQQLVTHALSPHIASLDFLREILATPIMSSSDSIGSSSLTFVDPNVAGYLSVLRSVLASLSRLVHPTYLPVHQFDSLVAAFEAMYANPEASLLRGNFWGLFAESDSNPIREEEWQIFDVAAKRFPVEVGPLTRMLLAVSGGRSSDLMDAANAPIAQEEDDFQYIATRCADHTVQYLARPQSLTQSLPAISPLMPLPYEPSRANNASPTDIIATRPIHISPSLTIPPGTPGRVVSPFDQRPLIISWELANSDHASLSMFRLYGDYLKAFAARLSGKKLGNQTSSASDDLFETPGDQGVPESFFRPLEEQLSDITSALALLRNVLQRLPRKSEQILEATFGDVQTGVRTLFTILERTAVLDHAATLFVVTANIVTVLLATHPDEIWTSLRGSDVVFPVDKSSSIPVWGTRTNASSRNTLIQDKVLGEYDRTLACLEVVQGLVLQAQWSLASDPPSEMKATVLKRATHWMITSVFTSYTTWKYRNLRQKFEIGTRLAGILIGLLQEPLTGAQGSLSAALHVVSEALLIRPGHAQLSALMSIVDTGNSVLGTLQRLGKPMDCSIVEICIHRHLQLINRILQMSRRAVANSPAMIERLLFAHDSDSLFRSILPDASQSPIYMLIGYLVNCGIASIATEAAGVLTKLCRLSVDWGPPSERPSFLSHLGSIRDTESIISRLVDLAGDPFGDVDLQLATWRLLTAILASQPGFSALLVTGRQALDQFGGLEMPVSHRTASLTLAMDVLYGWEEAWDVQPAILSAALSFLLELWQNYADSSKALLAVRQEEKMWITILNILQHSQPLQNDEGTGYERDDGLGLDQVHRCYAQAAAAALYAVELQASSSSTSRANLSSNQEVSIKVFRSFLRDSAKVRKCCTSATEAGFDERNVSEIKSKISKAMPGLDLDSYIQLRLVDCAPHGPDFYYDSAVLAKRLVGYARKSPTSSETKGDFLNSIHQSNILWSRADAEGARLRATITWFLAGLPYVRIDQQTAVSLQSACEALLQTCQIEQDATGVAEAHYAGSLQLTLAMVQHLSWQRIGCSAEVITALITRLGSILTKDTFPVDANLRSTQHVYPEILFKLAYHSYHISSKLSALSTTKKNTESKCYEAAEVSLSSCLRAYSSLVIAAKDSGAAKSVKEDIIWAAAAICEILSSTFCPPSSSWLAHCVDSDFFRHCLDYIAATPFDLKDASIAQSILDTLLAMAGDARAAEKMALEGVVHTLCNNAMSDELQAGSLQEQAPLADLREQDHSRYKLWILFVSIVTQLVCHLGNSIAFMDQEVSTFMQMYRLQLQQSLHWDTNKPLPLSAIQEIRAVLTLLSTCVKATLSRSHLQTPAQGLLQASLQTLPQLVYLLQHPNLLVSLIEPTTAAESDWLASDSGRSDAVDLSDFHSHPVVASLCQEVFSLCWLIVSILVAHTQCFKILVGDRVDWPKDRVIIAANANVSLDEAATFGTLFDLARFCTDVTRHCSTEPSQTQRNPALPQYNLVAMRATAEQCFEGTLLLMSTQVALTVHQQDLAGTEDRAAQRARRDLKELASDLVEEFLDKSSNSQEKKLPDLLKVFVLRL